MLPPIKAIRNVSTLDEWLRAYAEENHPESLFTPPIRATVNMTPDERRIRDLM